MSQVNHRVTGLISTSCTIWLHSLDFFFQAPHNASVNAHNLRVPFNVLRKPFSSCSMKYQCQSSACGKSFAACLTHFASSFAFHFSHNSWVDFLCRWSLARRMPSCSSTPLKCFQVVTGGAEHLASLFVFKIWEFAPAVTSDVALLLGKDWHRQSKPFGQECLACRIDVILLINLAALLKICNYFLHVGDSSLIWQSRVLFFSWAFWKACLKKKMYTRLRK